MIGTHVALAVTALLGTLASAGHSQHPQVRKGFWIGFGLGYGSGRTSSTVIAGSEGTGGGTGFLKMGGTLSQKVLLGGESNVLVRPNVVGTDRAVLQGNTSLAVYFYPAATAGFFMKGGVGFSNYLQSNLDVFLEGSGWGLLAGVGYDIRVGRNVSLTPVVNYYYGQLGDMTMDGSVIDTGVSQSVIDIGLGITFH
jgi:hypothetical protein